MTRQEAHELLLEVIDAIYKDIGTCKDCTYCRVTLNKYEKTQYKCTQNEIPTSKEIVSSNFYCANFKKRGQDE